VSSVGGDIIINSADALTSLTGLENLTSVVGNLEIYFNVALTSHAGLEDLAFIGGELSIYNNDALISLTGLGNVTSIGGNLGIRYNNALMNLEGLGNVTSVGGDLGIVGNALTSLTGLENLTSCGGSLDISFNDALTSLTGLENLTSIEGDLYISDNAALTSLTGLDNIEDGSITEIGIQYNYSLATCEVQSVCDFLAAPNGVIVINDNAPGCNSPEEVEAACDEVSIESIGFKDDYLLFPNPAGKAVTISGNNTTAIREILIYNQTGQKVQQVKPVNNTLDISKLRPGMYIVELVTDKVKVRKKLMVE